MPIYTFSVPDDEKEKFDKIFEDIKKRHLNKSSIIRDLIEQLAKEKGYGIKQ